MLRDELQKPTFVTTETNPVLTPAPNTLKSFLSYRNDITAFLFARGYRPKMNINAEPISLKALQAFQNNPQIDVDYTAKAMGQNFALVVVGKKHYALEAARGGTRGFKTLNAVLVFMGRHLGNKRFSVEGEGWTPKQREIAA